MRQCFGVDLVPQFHSANCMKKSTSVTFAGHVVQILPLTNALVKQCVVHTRAFIERALLLIDRCDYG